MEVRAAESLAARFTIEQQLRRASSQRAEAIAGYASEIVRLSRRTHTMYGTS